MKCQLLKYCIVVVLLFLNLVSYAQFNNDNKQWYNLHGKVRCCVETGYNLIKGDTTGKHIINSFDSVVFNNKRQAVETYRSNTVRGADINKRIFTAYKYDNKGNLIEQLYHDFDGKPEAKLIYSYAYVKKLVTLRIYFLLEKDSSRVSDSYKINASGRILEIYHYNESFVPDVKYQYGKTVYKYDVKGLRIEEIEYDLNGLERSQRFWKYNRYNDLSKTTYIWLKDQRANEEMSFVYTKYDKYHNWLVRNRFIHGRLHSISERQITYYK